MPSQEWLTLFWKRFQCAFLFLYSAVKRCLIEAPSAPSVRGIFHTGRPDLPSRAPTIDDVATLAGVGRTTVSRVLNEGPNVRPALRSKVQAAIEALDFKVNMRARALATGDERGIALICSINVDAEPNSYYHSALEIGAMRSCARTGFHLTTHRIAEQSTMKTQEIMAIAGRGQIGIILTPPFSDDPALLALLVENGNPLCCISPGEHVPGIDSVGIDDHRAGEDAARYLRELGHTRFGFIAGPASHRSAERRLAGFRKSFEMDGGEPADLAVARGDFSFRSGRDGFAEIIGQSPVPTVIMCANDDMAAGALFAAHEYGLGVPADLSIMGFDDTPVSSIVWPPLTTIHQPLREMAERAANMIANGRRQGAAILPHDIVPRASVCGIERD
jgi:LacI family transcriptional regulator